jgi:hypothetical protein
MSYELDFSNSVSLDGNLIFSNTTITPNALLGAEFRFNQDNATLVQDMDFTFADVTATAGVQAILVRSDVPGTVKFRDSSDTVLLTVTLEVGKTLIGLRDDNNTVIPYNFTIPNSGTVDDVQVDKTTSGSGFQRTGDVTIWVYYNRTRA